MVNIYAGNLSYGLEEDELRAAFEQYGKVDRVALIIDKLTGRSRGFGFVEMADETEARNAIAALHDIELRGRKLLIREAYPKDQHPRPRSDQAPRAQY